MTPSDEPGPTGPGFLRLGVDNGAERAIVIHMKAITVSEEMQSAYDALRAGIERDEMPTTRTAEEREHDPNALRNAVRAEGCRVAQ